MADLRLRRRKADGETKETQYYDDDDDSKEQKRTSNNTELAKSKPRPSSWISFKWGGSGRSVNHDPQKQPTSTRNGHADQRSSEKHDDSDDSNDSEDDDDDDSWDATNESLLSDRESLDGSDYERISKDGAQRLRRRFVIRNRILTRLAHVKSTTFVNMLRCNELAARRIVEEKHRRSLSQSEVEYILPNPPPLLSEPEHNDQVHADYDKKDGAPTKRNKAPPVATVETCNATTGRFKMLSSSSSRKPSTGLTKFMEGPLTGFLVFEFYQGLPSCLLVFVYCLSAYTFFALVDGTLSSLAVYCKPYVSLVAFDSITIMLSYAIMRATGYVWIFVDDDSYLSAKFDMHNRAKLGYWDARVMSYFKTHSRLASFLNLVAFYTIYAVSVGWYDMACRSLIFVPAETWCSDVVMEAKQLALSSGMKRKAVADLTEYEAIQTFIQGFWRRFIGGRICRSNHDYTHLMFPCQALFCVLLAQLQGYLGNDFITSVE